MTPQEARQVLKGCRHLFEERSNLRCDYETYVHTQWRDTEEYRNTVGELLNNWLVLEKKAVKRLECIKKALGHLPPLESRILRLHFVQGKTWRKVASETGYSEEHVKGYLQRRALKMFAAAWPRDE